MQTLVDFLSFRAFLSPAVLMGFYYLGAVVMPVAAWLFALWLRRRFVALQRAEAQGKALLLQLTRARERWLIGALFGAMFLMMEIFWRMLFEYLIGFIRALQVIIAQGGIA
jgi:hypothetical protein